MDAPAETENSGLSGCVTCGLTVPFTRFGESVDRLWWGWRVSDGCPARVSGIEEQSAGDELVLYDLRAGRLHHLNSTAAAIWRLCDGTVSPAQIVASMTRQFAVPETNQPESDLEALLQEWMRAGLIRNQNSRKDGSDR